MSTPRYGSSSVPIPGGIWVTGGKFTGRYNSKLPKLKTTEKMFLNKTKQVGPPLPAARSSHCLVNFEGKIFSTGGYDENYDVTFNVWQFNAADNFAKADGPEMKNTRYSHGCGIVHSIHRGSRLLLVVAGSDGGTGAKNSEYWDFTVTGSTWQLCSKSCSFFSYYTSLV